MSELDQVQASGDALPGIIWMIFLAIWALGKFLQRFKPSDSENPPSQESASPSSLENQLRDFLETVTGETLSEKPPPVRPRAQPALPPNPTTLQEQREAQRSRTSRSPRPIDAPPVAQRAPTAAKRKSSPPTRLPKETPFKTIGQGSGIEDQLELLPSPELHGSHKYMLAGSHGLTMKMQGMRLPDTEHEANATIRYNIPDKAGLKRAMIDRIVLGPPRGISDFVQEDLQKTK